MHTVQPTNPYLLTDEEVLLEFFNLADSLGSLEEAAEAIDEYLPDEVHEEINSALVFPTIPEACIKQAVATNRKAVIESLAKIRGWELPAT